MILDSCYCYEVSLRNMKILPDVFSNVNHVDFPNMTNERSYLDIVKSGSLSINLIYYH